MSAAISACGSRNSVRHSTKWDMTGMLRCSDVIPQTSASSTINNGGLVMIVYHRTSAAEEIIGEGFLDRNCCYTTDRMCSGVWVFECPLDADSGAIGNGVL